jgi:hypothetical protein
MGLGWGLFIGGLVMAALFYFIRWIQAEAGPDYWGKHNMPVVTFMGNLFVRGSLVVAALGLVIVVVGALSGG